MANELETEDRPLQKSCHRARWKPGASEPGRISSASAPTQEEAAAFRNALKQYYFYLYNAYDFYVSFDNLGLIGSSAGLKDCQGSFEELCGGLNTTYDAWREWIASPQEMYQVLVSKTTLTDVNSKFSLLKFPLFTNPQGQAVNLIITPLSGTPISPTKLKKWSRTTRWRLRFMTVTTICYPPPLTATPPPGPQWPQLSGASGLLEAWVQGKADDRPLYDTAH